MGVERLPVAELVLDEIRHCQDRIIGWTVIGFAMGFAMGAILAAFLITLK